MNRQCPKWKWRWLGNNFWNNLQLYIRWNCQSGSQEQADCLSWEPVQGRWFTTCGAACKLPELLCSSLYLLTHDTVMWDNKRVISSSWCLFSSSGSQGKNGTVQSDVHCPHWRTCILFPVLCGDISAEESNQVDLQQVVVSTKSVPTAIHILLHTLLDPSFCFGSGFFCNGSLMSSKGNLQNMNHMSKED